MPVIYWAFFPSKSYKALPHCLLLQGPYVREDEKLRQRACRIQVDFDQPIQSNIHQYRSNKSHAKTMVLDFIAVLIDEGYRHFIIYIDLPTDLWIAEILYLLIPSYKPLGIT